jgi:hypothetical protein
MSSFLAILMECGKIRMIRLKAKVRYSTVSQGLRAIQNVSFATAPGA